MTLFVIAQLIGFLGFALGIAAFLQKDDLRLKIFMLCQAAALSVHFVMLGAYTGGALTLLASIRAGLSLFKWGRHLAPLFYVLTLTVGYFTYQEPVDILPILGGLCGTTAFFYLTGVRLRLMFLLGSSFWLIHNLIVGSIGPYFMESFMIIANLRTLWHLHRDKKAAADASGSRPADRA